MSFKKNYELAKASDAIKEAMDVVYDHDFYGLPTHLPEGTSENECDPYYDDLHQQLLIIKDALDAQIK